MHGDDGPVVQVNYGLRASSVAELAHDIIILAGYFFVVFFPVDEEYAVQAPQELVRDFVDYQVQHRRDGVEGVFYVFHSEQS